MKKYLYLVPESYEGVLLATLLYQMNQRGLSDVAIVKTQEGLKEMKEYEDDRIVFDLEDEDDVIAEISRSLQCVNKDLTPKWYEVLEDLVEERDPRTTSKMLRGAYAILSKDDGFGCWMGQKMGPQGIEDIALTQEEVVLLLGAYHQFC